MAKPLDFTHGLKDRNCYLSLYVIFVAVTVSLSQREDFDNERKYEPFLYCFDIEGEQI